MPAINEPNHRGEFILSEADRTRSRTARTLDTGQNLVAGTVLGQLTAGGNFKILNPAGADGSETAAGILYGSVNASAADSPCVVCDTDMEVSDHSLTWPAGITQPQKDAAVGQLLALGIKILDLQPA